MRTLSGLGGAPAIPAAAIAARPLTALPPPPTARSGFRTAPSAPRRDVQRGAGPLGHHVRQQVGAGRLRPRVPGRRGVGLGRVGLEVEEHRRDVHARDAVDERVVGLGDQGEGVLADAVDQPQLPQWLGAVQPLGEDPPGQVAQLLLAGGARQRRVAHVVAGVEVRVVDPDRAALHERRPRELLAVARHEVQALLELGDEVLVAAAPRRRTRARSRRACARRCARARGTTRRGRSAGRGSPWAGFSRFGRCLHTFNNVYNVL